MEVSNTTPLANTPEGLADRINGVCELKPPRYLENHAQGKTISGLYSAVVGAYQSGQEPDGADSPDPFMWRNRNDGVPAKDYLKEYARIGMVLQKNESFTGTILKNLSVTLPKEAEKSLWLQVHDFILTICRKGNRMNSTFVEDRNAFALPA